METFKVGDVVARKSYNLDVLFKITRINANGMVDLAGLTVRIIADAPDYDLQHISKEETDKRVLNTEKSRVARLNRCYMNMNKKINGYYNIREQVTVEENPNVFKKESILKKPGIVLHIDGDPEYTDRCKESYKRMGVTAYTYNIPEQEQYKQIYSLLQKIRPNILILTGHGDIIYPENIYK
ncbi:MAG: sporulation peptidase YabG [Clostridia bacterium]|nr:sporulation peptidase YabG [Clostridia bacterium]